MCVPQKTHTEELQTPVFFVWPALCVRVFTHSTNIKALQSRGHKLKSMVQVSTLVYLLGGLLGLVLPLPVLTASTPASMCTPLKTLNDSLSHRRRYMKHNFPINYTIRVHHEEIFRLSNINRMRLQVEGLDELVLQRLWFQVNQGVLKKIIRVMPERHPSRPYTTELERRFRDAEGVFVQSHPAEVFQQELPETIQDTWDHLTEEPDRLPESSWRYASPKSLLDNLCNTMHCLFSECFASAEVQQDYFYTDGLLFENSGVAPSWP
ncbi:interleukin-34 isoform X2 [Centropristis striata]|uniref:interleukin-34 isoform X2 n=1 Tax=Centropristis striata TaxID=184440 RepID=UPI0027DED027|nr:interleukin-34 isoform X2 [Centropristis striata]